MDNQVGLMIDYTNIVAKNKLDRLQSVIGPLPSEIVSSVNKNGVLIGLILVINQGLLKQLEMTKKGADRVRVLNSDSFVHGVRGYVYFTYDTSTQVCQLYGNNQYRDGILEIVLSSIMTYLPLDTTILVRIPINDMETTLSQVLSNNFTNPWICTGNSRDKKDYLCMTRRNTLDNTPINHSSVQSNIRYLISQYLLDSPSCSMSTRLSNNAIRYLHNTIQSGSTMDSNGFITQKEIAGRLLISSITPDDMVHIVDVDTTSTNTGNEQSVQVVNGLFNFHSHPISAYEAHGVSLGWPSGQDYVGFYSSFIESGTILHVVSSIEGLYVITLGNFWLNKRVGNGIDYGSITSFILSNYDLCSKRDKMTNTPEQYVNRINHIFYQDDKTLFKVVYLPWSDAANIFEVIYPKSGKNCITIQNTRDYIDINENKQE